MTLDPIALTERFVASAFPNATIAVMAGSTARGERTSTSDIDLLLIGDVLFPDAETSSIATTLAFEGEIFEVFGYTPAAFEEWALRDIAQHRPVIVNMLLDGIAVRADAAFATLRERWATIRDAGPQVDAHELEVRRYIITDLLDDLGDAADPAERHVIAATLFERTAHLMLLDGARWIAAGKHLPRALRSMDPVRAAELIDPWVRGELDGFAAAAAAELDRAGGRVQADFTR